MKWNKQKLVIAIFIVTALMILAQSAHAPTSQTHSLDTKGSDGSYFNFDNDCNLWFDAEQIYLGDSNGLWTWLGSYGIRFYNLRMDGDSISTWSIYVDSANVTINDFFKDNKLAFTVTAPTWTVSTTQVYCGDYGKPASVTGALSWSYNFATNIVTVNILHFSSQQIELEWVLPPALVSAIRNNFAVAFSLISLIPIICASTIIIALVKGRENLDENAIYGFTGIVIVLILSYIILIQIINALL